MSKEYGVTLLELLIVMTIIGILMSVAVPQYTAYTQRAFDTRARTDLYNIAIAEEAYFSDSESYLSCADETCRSLPGVATLSKGVTLAITATPTGFTGSSHHVKGSGRVFAWNSEEGGMLEE